ncbi:phosphoribosylglycinamide formyltransferase [Melissococcus plutonius]|uniref:Phosphoribosylglycinamide formyltransferase n=1 Tax=Melissococcus plutonius TaxID=33970 RepID=A0A2Z5Y1T2_9ENTE|nr:phosphoribosylglycinamide formyltransferase [Melissococcus plutonius]MCV2499307.1 phosphoribosylglycinamide formyltransferase [Melissococcus plutonius]MCV2500950.1 phosphoribosylglycinamide formyltransferase [Melissococcus plutonius]MCV2505622.1 phosphoribosylglycinamide formyltransferase [Melissococcus plutonius]MCV2507929.1 phosphoribosylglycinamide formyltransferase [Melissococcus plutonius]MCV2520364.1 phosphoribosylglycinamide formyltransferase [Melissococcus plutonius]
MKIAVFASGNGSNFQAILDVIKEKKLPISIEFLFCDQPQAFVIKRALKQSILAYCFSQKSFTTKEEYEMELLKLLKKHQVEWIILAGYMRLIGTTLLKYYPERIINIHPSLLPNFKGMHAIEEAYQAGVAQTGITIHYVDQGMDTGTIIAQEIMPISKEDTLESLEKKIHQLEHQLYPKVLADIFTKAERKKTKDAKKASVNKCFE